MYVSCVIWATEVLTGPLKGEFKEVIFVECDLTVRWPRGTGAVYFRSLRCNI